MGIVIEITSLEEMCDLMCNNALPEREEAFDGGVPDRAVDRDDNSDRGDGSIP